MNVYEANTIHHRLKAEVIQEMIAGKTGFSSMRERERERKREKESVGISQHRWYRILFDFEKLENVRRT